MSQQTLIFTYVTQPLVTQLFRRAEPYEWLEITLRLETAGPVAIGHSAELAPVLSGKGRLIPTGQDIVIRLSPSSSLFILSDTVDRVSAQINSVPGLEDVLKAIRAFGAAQKPTGEQVDIGRWGFQMPPKGKR